MPGGARYTSLLLELTGDRQLERKLSKMAGSAQTKITRPAIVRMLAVIRKAQRAACSNAALRRTIKSRLMKARRSDDVAGKVGAGVGARGKKEYGERNGHGIGTPGADHWLILGTVQRFTGFTTRAKGQRGQMIRTKNPVANRGRMRPHKFIEQATRGAWPEAIEAARAFAADRLSEIAVE
jgi:hypothetical protein